MNKIFFVSTFLLATLNAHECTYTIEMNLDMDKGLIKGYASIFSDHPTLKLLDSKAKISEIKNASLNIEGNMPNLVLKDVNKPVEIAFTHSFRPIKGDAIVLEAWYPKIDIMCKHETIISSSDVTTIVEATSSRKVGDKKHFTFDYPLDNLNIIASKNYTSNSKITKEGMKLSTHFYANDAHLSQKYLQKTEEYFRLYKNIFGFLPFKEFKVVETPFPAGYSMPTFTLIGQQIIDKDFVFNSSLGHEIVHQWFGNYVYSPSQGNWAEGLTTFYSDYLYADKNGKGIAYRKDMLIKYNSYVNSKNEIALIEFMHKEKESKNAIGYQKSAFFFYMLEQKIGKKAFNKGIRQLLQKYPFKTANYKNLREIFEEASGKKLLDFFKRWVYMKGALEFSINNVGLMYVDDSYTLTFDTTNNMMSGYMPLTICSDDECLSTKIDLSQKQHSLKLDIEPTKIIFDENYNIFRKLNTKEIPPVLSKVLQANAIAVIDRADEKKFSKMKHIFKNFKFADTLTFEELKNNNIFVLGANNSLLKNIALPFEMQGDAKIELFKNPLNENNVIAVFEMKELSRSIFYKLQHLGKYSTVVFEKGEIIHKSTKPSLKGITYTINRDSYVIKPKVEKLNDMIDVIVKSKIVYVGESHTEFSSHLNQLKIIKAMYKKDKNMVIGMEMFQKPYQKYLDAYIEGKITEKEMVIKTEYFKRWKYDYELYRPIISFAKKHKIRILALNIDREITKKVVSEGMDALDDKQRAQVPTSIDFSNTKYKEQLRMIYGMHQTERFKNFEQFYHAQLIWDESMANNMVTFMQKNPKYNMVVLAGNGHIMHGHGIPSRVERRGFKDYTIALNFTKPEPGIADYLLYPSSITTKKATKLGVYLKDGDILEVLELVENSLAEKAEIKVGDILIKYNDVPLKNLFTLKTELAFIEKNAKLTVLRDSKEIEVTIDFSKVK